MKFIVREDVPCWFELSWQEKECAIVLRLHKQFVDSVPDIRQNTPIVIVMKKQFNFESFEGSLRNGFGFEKSFVCGGEKDDFFIHRISVPKIKIFTKEKCHHCQGSGKHPNFKKEKCSSCHGERREHEYDWKSAHAISASFTLFSMFARYNEVVTSCPFPQLLTFSTITDVGHHGGSLGGEYSLILCKWLAQFPENSRLPEMEKPMMQAYDRMLGLRDYDKHSFRSHLPYGNGWLNVSCPGDACSLHPSSGSLSADEGYRFDCHNVDTPMQQLTLLAGLAGLHDLARKEISC